VRGSIVYMAFTVHRERGGRENCASGDSPSLVDMSVDILI